MYVVGLTGGIGSGKSTVAKSFSELDIVVVDADNAAREVVEPGTDALKKIQRHFGDNILLPNDSLNRKALRSKIFDDQAERIWLEQLLHPLIRDLIKKQLSDAQSIYVILESPLLLETSQQELADRTLVIDASEDTQLNRVLSRDGSTEQEIRAIMAAQMTRDKRLSLADDVILNDQDEKDIKPAILKLHEQYLRLAKQKT